MSQDYDRGAVDSTNDAPPASGAGSMGTIGGGTSNAPNAGAVSDTDAEGTGAGGSIPADYMRQRDAAKDAARDAARDANRDANRDVDGDTATAAPDPDTTPGYDVNDDPSRGFLPGQRGDMGDSPPGTD